MSIPPDNAAPTGRKKLAQGDDPATAGDAALGHASRNTPSPAGAKQGAPLPNGWTRLTLGDVGRWFGGGTPSKSNPRFWTGGNIPWVSPKDMKFNLITDAQDHITDDAVAQSATNLVESGSVLIVVRSGILQHTLPVAVTQRQVALNQDLKAVTPGENIRADYLALALKAFEQDILHSCTKTGTTVQSLELPVFLRFEIPVAPLPEQRRIVAEIEKQFTRLEAGVAALRRVQANLKRYRAAVLKAACEGKLVPTEAELQKCGSGVPPLVSSEKRQDAASTFETGEALLQRILAERRKNWTGRGKYKEPTAHDTANLPPLPEGWTWASVDQLAEETMIGLDRGRSQQTQTPSSGVPYIKMNNVTMEGRVLYDDMAYVPANAEESERFAVQAGDILFNTRNSTELVGKIGIIRNAPDGAIYNNNLMRIRVPRGVLPEFLCSQMCSHGFRQRMELVKKATTSVAAVYQKDLLPLPIALPPIAEQTRIVAEAERRLSVVEELESVVSANLKRAGRLQQSILEKAFTGELV